MWKADISECQANTVGTSLFKTQVKGGQMLQSQVNSTSMSRVSLFYLSHMSSPPPYSSLFSLLAGLSYIAQQ